MSRSNATHFTVPHASGGCALLGGALLTKLDAKSACSAFFTDRRLSSHSSCVAMSLDSETESLPAPQALSVTADPTSANVRHTRLIDRGFIEPSGARGKSTKGCYSQLLIFADSNPT